MTPEIPTTQKRTIADGDPDSAKEFELGRNFQLLRDSQFSGKSENDPRKILNSVEELSGER